MIKARLFFAGMTLALAQTALAAENATLLKASELREKPFNDAKVISTLAAKSEALILQRKGAWAQVQSGKQSGWVKLLTLVTLSGKKGDSGLANVNKIFKTDSTSKETTTGVKGFSADKLEAFKKAKPDYQEMKKLDGYEIKADRAAQFAAEAKLSAREIPELPETVAEGDTR